MEQSAAPQSTNWPPRQVIAYTLVVLAIACGFYILFRFRLVFFSLFVAIVISTAVDPLIKRLSRLGISRKASIILISLVILLVTAILILTVVPLISEQWATITALLNTSYEELRKTLLALPSLMIYRIAMEMPTFLALNPAAPAPPDNTGSMETVQQAFNVGGYILHAIILIVAVLLLTGLWILEGDIASRMILMALPQQKREPVRAFTAELVQKVGAYTRGLAILLLAVGVLSTIAFVSIGLPNALLLGIAAGLLEIVPLVGPALGAIPALLVAASTDPTKVIWVLGAYILIQFAESHFLVPRVMDRTVGVNPVASLLAFVAFGAIFGFAGAILAVPLAAVVQLILNHFVFDANPIDQVPLTGRSGLSTLRYEAQGLVQDIRKQIRGKEAEVTAREDRIEDAMEAIAQDLDSILAQSEIDHELDRI